MPELWFSGAAPERAADWTSTPYNGLDAMNPGGAGDPVGDDPPAWCALPPSARPIPICYRVDWTRNHTRLEKILAFDTHKTALLCRGSCATPMVVFICCAPS